MNDYTDIASRLLSVAADRAGRGARHSEIIYEFWRTYDLAEGLGEALRWLADDSVDTHPITVRNARILSVGEPAQGCPVRWAETDRDGNTSERDANLGSLRNPAVRAVYDIAKDLAGRDVPCTLVVAYQPNDEGWETKDERGKTIRPGHFRRIARITRHRNVVGEEPDETTQPAAERRPVHGFATPPNPPAGGASMANQVTEQAPAVSTPQPTLADAQPPPVVVDERPADPALVAIAEMLSDEELADDALPLRPDVVAAYKAWFTTLARSQGRLRALNKDAARRGEGVASIHDAQTVLDLLRVVNLTRDLLAEQAAHV